MKDDRDMDFIVLVDAAEKDLHKLLDGSKRMLLRASGNCRFPTARVHPCDRLYFVQNDGTALVQARAMVSMVYRAAALTAIQARQLLQKHQDVLRLSPAQQERWARKSAMELISFWQVEPLEPFPVEVCPLSSPDDWHAVGRIEAALV